MEYVSIFDMFKIGVGPSSSHTLGPWRASQKFLEEIAVFDLSRPNMRISVTLHGSLSLTGKGHATDYAVILGLAGYDPVTIDTSQVLEYNKNIKKKTNINFNK